MSDIHPPAAARILIGQTIASLKSVTRAAGGAAHALGALEIETKSGRLVHFAPGAGGALTASPGPVAGSGAARVDLTERVPVAFDGRPEVRNVVPEVSGGRLVGCRFELTTGASFCYRATAAGPVLESTAPPPLPNPPAAPKYSLPEIERRWLVDPRTGAGLAAGPGIRIRDKYINGTRLRLRAARGRALKLGKKYGNRDGPVESIGNLYLEPLEHARLDALPGLMVTKVRHPVAGGSLDVYGEAEYVFEVTFDTPEAAARFEPPAFAGRELTADPDHSGLALAERWGRRTGGLRVVPAGADQYDDILALNESAVPNVNRISRATLERLADAAWSFTVAEDGGTVAGFLLVLPEGASYDSPNYRYFAARHERFAYVDRVVVAEAYRGTGIGQLLYERLLAPGLGKPLVTCEVNLKPPNPGSLAFHRQLGFEVVAEQDTEGGRKRVALMARAC